mgnify:CR=1 FL=1
MALKTKFIWNILITISIVVIFYSGSQLFEMEQVRKEFWETYKSETIGTDDILKDQVITMEESFFERASYDFRIRSNPTTLLNVIDMDISNFGYFQDLNKIQVTAIISASEPRAIINYQNKNFLVFKGDEVGGGKIISITRTEVIFKKDGEEYHFSLSPVDKN